MSANRLLRLARRVYGNEATVYVHGKTARVDHGAATMLHVYGNRCADALDAALLVLAGELPTWVEQLAANWEKRGRSIRHEWLGAGFLTCAVELRDLAAGKLELHAGGIRVRKEGTSRG